MTTPSTDQIMAAVRLTAAVGQAIRELGTVPSGHLYARLMNRLTLEEYDRLIDVLIRAGVVKRHASHLLEWVGPRDVGSYEA